MKKATLTIKEALKNSNTFYGKTLSVKSMTDVQYRQIDNRTEIPPFGVRVSFKVNENYTIVIEANKYYFVEDYGFYTLSQTFDEGVYEVNLYITEDDEIANVEVRRWLSASDFENCNEEDEYYCLDDFIEVKKV